MGIAIAAAITSLLPWILAWFALGGNSESVAQNIQNFGAAVTKGPVQVAVNAWIEVAVVAAALGFAVWIAESKTAKHLGQEVSAPPVESIHVAAPPTFGSTGGFSAGSGGITTHASVNSQAGGSGSAGVGTPGRRITKKTTTKKSSAFGE